MSGAVFILPFEGPQRAKSSFVGFSAAHLRHGATNSCCVKSCLLVTIVKEVCREREDDVRLGNVSKLSVSSPEKMEYGGILATRLE